MKYQSFPRVLSMLISISIGTIVQSYFAYFLNGPLDLIKDWLNVHPPAIGVKEGILVTSYNVGGFLGCIISFFIVKTTSRRYMVFLMDTFYLIGSLACIIPNFYIFIVGRVIQGLGAGTSTIITPMFLKEIIPVEIYGVIGTQNLVFLSFGSITQSLMALGFQSTFNYTFWLIYLFLPLFFCLLRTLLLFILFRHDSPFYNAQTGKITEAYQFVDYIYKPEFRDEIKIILKEASLVRKSFQESNRSFLKEDVRPRVLLGVFCNILYALTGITAMISYSTIIFKQVTTETIAKILTVGMTVIKFIFYSTGAFITQKYGSLHQYLTLLGRRKPLIIGTFFLSFFLFITGFASYENSEDSNIEWVIYTSIISIYLYFLIFFNSVGAIIPIYTPEVLPEQAQALALSAQWTFSITVTFIFPVIKNFIREQFGICYNFWLFGIIMLLAGIYFIKAVKETQGLSENQINLLFQKSSLQHLIHDIDIDSDESK